MGAASEYVDGQGGLVQIEPMMRSAFDTGYRCMGSEPLYHQVIGVGSNDVSVQSATIVSATVAAMS